MKRAFMIPDIATPDVTTPAIATPDIPTLDSAILAIAVPDIDSILVQPRSGAGTLVR